MPLLRRISVGIVSYIGFLANLMAPGIIQLEWSFPSALATYVFHPLSHVRSREVHCWDFVGLVRLAHCPIIHDLTSLFTPTSNLSLTSLYIYHPELEGICRCGSMELPRTLPNVPLSQYG